jgi:hypothetical protein
VLQSTEHTNFCQFGLTTVPLFGLIDSKTSKLVCVHIEINASAHHFLRLYCSNQSNHLFASLSFSQASDLEPSFHCCVSERVLDVVDSKDKFVDFPSFLGGSDIRVTGFMITKGSDNDEDNDAQLVRHGS